MKTIRLTSTHELDLPDDLNEQRDIQLSSFWRASEPLLLQVSSYVRSEGSQVPAKQRLKERIEKMGGSWHKSNIRLHPDLSLDQAVAETIDPNGVAWMHAYFVWPHLAVYATVSGPPECLADENWAVNALRTLRLVIQ